MWMTSTLGGDPDWDPMKQIVKPTRSPVTVGEFHADSQYLPDVTLAMRKHRPKNYHPGGEPKWQDERSVLNPQLSRTQAWDIVWQALATNEILSDPTHSRTCDENGRVHDWMMKRVVQVCLNKIDPWTDASVAKAILEAGPLSMPASDPQPQPPTSDPFEREFS